jgi:hypothetical protein
MLFFRNINTGSMAASKTTTEKTIIEGVYELANLSAMISVSSLQISSRSLKSLASRRDLLLLLVG